MSVCFSVFFLGFMLKKARFGVHFIGMVVRSTRHQMGKNVKEEVSHACGDALRKPSFGRNGVGPGHFLSTGKQMDECRWCNS